MKSYDYYLNSQISETWAGAPNVFDPNECEKIIKLGDNETFKEGLVNTGSSDPIRKSQIFFIESSDPENSWIFERCADMIQNINYDFFQFDLQKIEVLQVGKYESKDSGYYGKHIDAFRQSGMIRKLSFSVQLSRTEDYEGGDLLLHLGKDPDVAPRDRGSITVFPSYTLHEVTPVTKGTRYSLVGWVTSATKFK